jgi:hypothetical protein
VQRRHAACLVIRAAAAARPVFNRRFNRNGMHTHLLISALDDYDDDMDGGGGGVADDGHDYDYENDDDMIEFPWNSVEIVVPNHLTWCNWCRSMRQRLLLMRSSSPLAVVACRMASSVDKFAGGSRLEHAITVQILRRCSSVLAWRLWMDHSKARVRSVGDREIIHEFTHQQHLKEQQEYQIAKRKKSLERQQRYEAERRAELKFSQQESLKKTGAIIAVLAVAWTWPHFALYFALFLVLGALAILWIFYSAYHQ